MYFLNEESNNLSISALHLQIDAIRNGVITVDNPAKLIQHYEQQIAVLESRSSLGKRNQIAIQQNIADLPLSVRYNATRNYSTLYSIVQKQPVICIINIKENTDEKMGDEHCQRKEILVTAHVENERIKVGTIGIEYFSAKNFKDFERLCQKYELSYIRPIDYVIDKFLNYTVSPDTLEEVLKLLSKLESQAES